MSVNVSPIFTPMHDEEAKKLVSSHEESIRKVVRNLNYFGNTQPLGTIKFINVNQPGVTPVNTATFMFCDGTEINSPTSPLRTIGLNVRFVPNLVPRFPRGAGATTGNAMGGSDQWLLAHSHGGATGGMDSLGSFNGQEGEDRKSTTPHSHDITGALTDHTYDFPAYVGMAAYMKIR